MSWQNSIICYLIKHECIKEEDRELYAYGIQLMAMTIFNIGFSMVLGMVFGVLPYILGFLFLFIPLRSFAGGYHAESAKLCAVISQMILLVAALVAAKVSIYEADWYPLFVCCILFGGFQIVKKAPSEAKNKPLGAEEKSMYRKKTVVISGIEGCIGILAFMLKLYGAAYLTAMVFLIEGVLLLLNTKERAMYEEEI